MLDEITPEQFENWQAYSLLEPFDEMRGDYRTALIVKTMWDLKRDRKRHPRPFPIEQFLFTYGGASSSSKSAPTRKQTVAERSAALRALARSYAAKGK